MISIVKRGSLGFAGLSLFCSLSLAVPAQAVSGTDHTSAEVAKATPEVSFREAVWQLERDLRDRLESIVRSGVAGAGAASGPGAEPAAELLTERWHALRRAAEDLAGPESGELLNKLQATRPLLRAVEKAEVDPDSRDALARPWRGPEARGVIGFDAAEHSDCAHARDVDEAVLLSRLGPSANELWLQHRLAFDGLFGVSTAGSTFDTTLEIYRSCPGAGDRPLRSADDEVGLQARTGYRAVAGDSVFIRIQGWNSAAGSLVVELGGGLTALAGRVIRESTTLPLTSTRVLIWDSSDVFAGSARTDAGGDYFLFGLNPGTYFVTTDVGTYGPVIDELFDNLSCAGGAPSGCTPSAGTPVLLTDGEITSGIDFALSDGGSVSGRVRDAVTGLALQGARVEIFSSTGDRLRSASADATGRFLVGGLPPQDVFAVVPQGYPNSSTHAAQLYRGLPCSPSCDPTTGVPIPVQNGETTPDIDFFLVPLGAIEGTLTDALTGLPIAFERVEVFGSTGNFVESSLTGADGRYRVGGLSAGTYFLATDIYGRYFDELYDDLPCEPRCDATTGTPVPVANASVTTGIDFALNPLGSISGTVTDATTGAGLTNGNVELWNSAGSRLGSTYIGSQGSYRFTPLLPGTYFVTTLSGSHLDQLYDALPCEGGCDVTTGTGVVLQPGVDRAGIDFSLTSLGAIEGVVTDAATGDPLDSFTVRVWDSAGGLAASTHPYGSGGSYRIEGLDSGTYFVSATAGFHVGELYDDLPCPGGPPTGCDPTTGSPVAVALGSTAAGIDFALGAQGSLSGTVRAAADGAGIGYATVELFDAAGGLLRRTSTNSVGGYAFQGLQTNDYFVRTEGSVHRGQLYDGLPCPGLQCDPTTGSPVAVVLGVETSGIDFDLADKRMILGTLATVTGQHTYSATIAIYNPAGILVENFSLSGSGAYSVPVDPGTWFVVGFGSYDFVPQLYDGIPCPGGGCDVTMGTPVVVPADADVAGIDFELDVAQGIVGRVTDGQTGLPMAGVAVDLWDDQGNRIDGRATSADGLFHFDPGTGTFFVSSDNGLGRQDEIWDDVPCPDGSAFNGLCDPLTGSPVILANYGDLAGGVDFELIVVEIFADGFESGDISAWSAAAP